jgi:hypothetical protein
VLGELEGSTEQAHCHRVSVNNKPTGLSTCLEKKLKYWPTLPRVGYRSNPRVNIYIYIWIRRVRLSSLDTTIALTMIQGNCACSCYKTLLCTNFTQSDWRGIVRKICKIREEQHGPSRKSGKRKEKKK